MTRSLVGNYAEPMASFPGKPVHQSARFFIGQVRSLAPAFANDGPLIFCQVAHDFNLRPCLRAGFCHSSSLEFGFALLEKSFHTFVLVFAGEAKCEQINFAAQALI